METKKCSLCKEEQPADIKHFRWIKRGKGRWDSWCRKCYARRTREYNAKHPDERRSRDQAYRARTLETRRAYGRKYGKEYNAREAVKVWKREHHRRLKQKCFDAYREGLIIACGCCNESTLDFLTLDHANNDGKNHREALGGRRNGPRFYKWLLDNNCPQDLGLRILCMNCNWARHWNSGICPHEVERRRLAIKLVTPACQAA